MQTIRELEQLHEDFYVPTFVIKVGRRDVVRELFLTVSSVSIDLKEKAAGRFSFTVASSFDWEYREFKYLQGEQRLDLLDLFFFGAPVEVSIGYGDPSKIEERPMLTGIITELATSFSAGGTPELTVSGYDDLYWMTLGKTTRDWEGTPDSEAVADVATRNDLTADVEPTVPVRERIDQNEETDIAFIQRLSDQNGYTFYLRDGTLVFRRRLNQNAPILELEWGKGLVGFSPEAKLGRQITEVIVKGRAPKAGEEVEGRATKVDVSGDGEPALKGPEAVEQATGQTVDTTLTIRTAVHTQDEAEARAKGIMEERAQDFVTGSGESIGLPEIMPDVNILLGGMGRGFSKTYYVSEATHTLDSGGYKTIFNVQETVIDGRA